MVTQTLRETATYSVSEIKWTKLWDIFQASWERLKNLRDLELQLTKSWQPQTHKTNNTKSLYFCAQNKEFEIYELIILFLMVKSTFPFPPLFVKQLSHPAFWQLDTSQETLFLYTNCSIFPKKSSFQSNGDKG